MKLVNTQLRNEEALTWEEVKEIILDGIYAEEFIVLHTKSEKGYIQMAEDEKGFVIEIRIYNGENFIHYRTFVEELESAILPFESYFDDKEYDYSFWEDVTEEFLD